jgi:hypothetical protein
LTVKAVGLVALPPGVVTWIFPVTAPAGTVAVICESEPTEKTAIFPPPKVSLDAPVKLVPVMVTEVPTGPLGGVKLRMAGVTRNFWLLLKVPPGVTAVT